MFEECESCHACGKVMRHSGQMPWTVYCDLTQGEPEEDVDHHPIDCSECEGTGYKRVQETEHA